jgi:hypothetical protein
MTTVRTTGGRTTRRTTSVETPPIINKELLRLTYPIISYITTTFDRLYSYPSVGEKTIKLNFILKSLEELEYIPIASIWHNKYVANTETLRQSLIDLKNNTSTTTLKVNDNVNKYKELLNKLYTTLDNPKYNTIDIISDINLILAKGQLNTGLDLHIITRGNSNLVGNISNNILTLFLKNGKYYLSGKGLLAEVIFNDTLTAIIDINVLCIVTINKTGLKYINRILLLNYYKVINARKNTSYSLYGYDMSLYSMWNSSEGATDVENQVIQNNTTVYLSKDLLDNKYKTLRKTITEEWTNKYKNVKVIENLTNMFFNTLQPLPKGSSITEQRVINDKLSLEFLEQELLNINEEITQFKRLTDSSNVIILI